MTKYDPEATIYVGTPEALQAEIGLDDCYKGKYIVAAFDQDGYQITPESAVSKKEAAAYVKEIGDWLRSEGQIVRVSWI